MQFGGPDFHVLARHAAAQVQEELLLFLVVIPARVAGSIVRHDRHDVGLHAVDQRGIRADDVLQRRREHGPAAKQHVDLAVELALKRRPIGVLASLDQLPFLGGDGRGAVQDDVFVLVCLQGEPSDVRPEILVEKWPRRMRKIRRVSAGRFHGRRRRAPAPCRPARALSSAAWIVLNGAASVPGFCRRPVFF